MPQLWGIHNRNQNLVWSKDTAKTTVDQEHGFSFHQGYLEEKNNKATEFSLLSPPSDLNKARVWRWGLYYLRVWQSCTASLDLQAPGWLLCFSTSSCGGWHRHHIFPVLCGVLHINVRCSEHVEGGLPHFPRPSRMTLWGQTYQRCTSTVYWTPQVLTAKSCFEAPPLVTWVRMPGPRWKCLSWLFWKWWIEKGIRGLESKETAHVASMVKPSSLLYIFFLAIAIN